MTVATPEGEPGRYVFAKLYAKNHVRADRWYKLGRTILYGALEDETPFGTVRRFVEYEDYTLRLMYDDGLPAPKPYGIVEITPEREYMIVMEFFDDAVEIGDADVSDHVIEKACSSIRRMWDIGLAHRDIKPANLMVQDGELRLIDVFFVQVRPSPWRQAVDLANMMMVLALRTDAPRVYERALRYFTPDEIAEAFAATRGVASPTQLRSLMKQQGVDLLAEFRALAPPHPADPHPALEPAARRTHALGAVDRLPRRVPGRSRTGTRSHEAPVDVASRRVAHRPSRSPRAPQGAAAGRPLCTDTEDGVFVLLAQSVPSATQLPCVSEFPVGWTFGGSDISRGLSRASGSTPTVAASMPSRFRSGGRATRRAPSRNSPRPTRSDTRVFVGPDSLNPSFTGDAVPAVRWRLHRLHVPLRERRLRRRSRSRPIDALSLAAPRHIVAEVREDPGSSLCGAGAPPCAG